MSKFSAREKVLASMSIALGVALVFGGRNLSEVSARERSDSTLFQELKTFTDVLSIVKRDYVSDVDNKTLVEGAIKGMLTALDPHSGYLDPDFYQDLQVQTKGEFGGLGIEITIKDGLLVVVAPMEGSPAEKAGVKPGDVIVKIDNKFAKEFSLVDAVKRLRGPKGSPVQVSLSRKGTNGLIDVTLVRDIIAVKSIRSRYLGEGLGYVRLSQFMDHTSDDLATALKAMAKESPSGQMKGLILDMRNNPGGLLAQAVRVSDMFLDEGVIVYTDGRMDSQKQKFYAQPRGTEPKYPIIVLVNGGSASAAEIVAGALKDHGRAIIVGNQTFGKGSVQTITPLENRGALTLTTALYYTKSGNSIQARGVKPDVEVSNARSDENGATEEGSSRTGLEIREQDLPGAIKNPSEKVSDEAESPLQKINKTPKTHPDLRGIDPEKDDLGEWLSRDQQFAKALDLLKGFPEAK
jgi:carboxyl-terminal processing protease